MKFTRGATAWLSDETLREIERKLGVSIKHPPDPCRCMTSYQEFAIYDEDGVHAGEIRSDGQYFTEKELRQKILALFGK